MKITRTNLKQLIREELSYLYEQTDMSYTVMSPMTTEPARFRDLDAAIRTAMAWERDGFLERQGTHPDVLDALDLEAGRHPGGTIG